MKLDPCFLLKNSDSNLTEFLLPLMMATLPLPNFKISTFIIDIRGVGKILPVTQLSWPQLELQSLTCATHIRSWTAEHRAYCRKPTLWLDFRSSAIVCTIDVVASIVIFSIPYMDSSSTTTSSHIILDQAHV